MVSLTWRPRMPPRAFTFLAHSWYPRSNAWPSAEKSPVSDSDAPMVIGPVGRLVATGVPLEVLELVHAARALSPSTVTAVTGKTFPPNPGGTRPTPHSSLPPQPRPGGAPRDRPRPPPPLLYPPRP